MPNRPTRMYLPSIHTSISAEDILRDTLSATLVVEDICWCVAHDDWISRQPHRWRRRKRSDWDKEHEALQQQRAQIKSLCAPLRRPPRMMEANMGRGTWARPGPSRRRHTAPIMSPPVTPSVLAMLVAAAAVVVALLALGALSYAYARIGISAQWLLLILAAAMLGSLVNIPVATLPPG